MEIAAPAIPVKFKRRNISAVRRFPPPPRPSGEVPVESGTLGELKLVEAPVLAKRGRDRSEELLEVGLEKKSQTPPVTSKRYPPPKRRRVSAVREYPAGCGRAASRIVGDEGGLRFVAHTSSPMIESSGAEKARRRPEKGKQTLEWEKMELERVETKQKQYFLEEKDGEKNIVEVNQRRATEGSVGVAHTENAEMELKRVETKREQALLWETEPSVYQRPEAEGPVQVTCTENAKMDVERIETKQKQELFRQNKLAVNQRPGDEASVGVTRIENAKMGANRTVTKQLQDFIREKKTVANHRPATEGFVGMTHTENTKMEAKRGETKQKQYFFEEKDGEKNIVEVNQRRATEGSVGVAHMENAEMELKRVETKRETKPSVYQRPEAEGPVQVTCTENAKMEVERIETKQMQELFRQNKLAVNQRPGDEASVGVTRIENAKMGSKRTVTKQLQDFVQEKKAVVNHQPEAEGFVGITHTANTKMEAKRGETKQKHEFLRKKDGEKKHVWVTCVEKQKQKLLQQKDGEKESEVKLLWQPEGSIRVASTERSHDEARRNVTQFRQRIQEISSETRFKSASEGSPVEITVKESSEKKISLRLGLERKPEGHVAEQFSKSFCIKEAQESMPYTKLSLDEARRNPKRKFAEAENRGFDSSNQTGGYGGLKTNGDRMTVQTQIAAQTCPRWQARKSSGTSNRSVTPENLTKQGKSWSKNSDFKGASASRNKNDMNEKDHAVYKLPSVVPLKPNHRGSCNEDVSARSKVKRALRLFQVLARTLLQGEESKSKSLGRANRIDLKVAGILKNNNQWVNRGEPILGPVPGVEVGDEFHYRVELSIVGLHRLFQGGIDRTKKNGVDLATSIVASGGYPDDMDSSDVLIYNGSGGIAIGKNKQIGDQKLERGNLALKNSIDAKNPVRVIYGFKELKESEDDARVKPISTFTYDGLYLVEKYWTEIGLHGFSVFKFQMRRMPGQPELALKEVKRSKMAKVREGLFQKDISQGKETMPICALNTTDVDRPIPFTYITKNIYPSWYVHKPPRGCDCTDGCLDAEKCACAVKNGGVIPFNHNGAIVQAKPLVYECGPSCNCRSCYNRVSQRGIKIPLEIFKTKSRGWGVRSLYSIPSGSFICEYVGELLKESDAQDRVNDEYLFEIGHNYEDKTLLESLPSLVPGLQSNFADEPMVDPGFTLDAAEYGNIGRFINHSCSPNIYAQNVLYDHDDKRMPHIMFFAADNIPPLQELTYDYNYRVDQVHDSDGNIKRKNCYCGSRECTGRLY